MLDSRLGLTSKDWGRESRNINTGREVIASLGTLAGILIFLLRIKAFFEERLTSHNVGFYYSQ